jgi:hypothetical protein
MAPGNEPAEQETIRLMAARAGKMLIIRFIFQILLPVKRAKNPNLALPLQIFFA